MTRAMRPYRVRFYTGPVEVHHFAARVAADDRINSDTMLLGTEHVYFTIHGAGIEDALATAKQVLRHPGSGYCIQPINQEEQP